MGRPRKNPLPQAETAPMAVETTPETLRDFGGDFTLAVPAHVDPATLEGNSVFNLYRGDVVLKAAPETRLQFATIDETGGLESTKTMVYARQDGWTEALASEFYLSERAQNVFQPDAKGRLTVGGSGTQTLVLFCRSEERYEEAMKRVRKYTTDVGKSAEERMGELGARLAYAGMMPSIIEETTDASGNVLNKRVSNFTSKVF